MYIRLGPGISPAGKSIWPDGKRSRFLPLMAFHCVSRRHASRGVERVKILGIVLHRWRRCVYHFFRGSILGSLEIGIDQIILRVQHIARRIVFAGCRFGSKIGFDRFLPKAEACKNMRRHVQRVRRVRRDLGIAARRIESASRERRIVVGVDNIMELPRDAPVAPRESFPESHRPFSDSHKFYQWVTRCLATRARKKWPPPGHRDSEPEAAPSLFHRPVHGCDGPTCRNLCRKFRGRRCSPARVAFWALPTWPWQRLPNLPSTLLRQALPRLDDKASWRFPSKPWHRKDLF